MTAAKSRIRGVLLTCIERVIRRFIERITETDAINKTWLNSSH